MFRVKSLCASVKRHHRAAGDLESGNVAHERETGGNRLGCPSAGDTESGDGSENGWLSGNQTRPRARLRGSAGNQRETLSSHAVLGCDVCLNGHVLSWLEGRPPELSSSLPNFRINPYELSVPVLPVSTG